MRVMFSLDEDDYVWLTKLDNRSEWLRERIAEAKHSDTNSDTGTTEAPDTQNLNKQ